MKKEFSTTLVSTLLVGVDIFGKYSYGGIRSICYVSRYSLPHAPIISEDNLELNWSSY